jgi:hypothetical protein
MRHALLAVLLAGCLHADEEVAKRASIEADCPFTQLHLTPRPELSAATYDVSACGRVLRYTCSKPVGYPLTCAREPDPQQAGPQR